MPNEPAVVEWRYNDSMSASKHLKVLSVRMPEPELRRFKSIAASRGINVQTAVHEALECWAAQPPRLPQEGLEELEGSLADVNVEELMKNEREAELKKDQRWS